MDMTQGTRFGARALRRWAVLTIVALLCTLGATATQASAQIDNNSDGFTAASAAAAARSELSQYGGQHECNNSGLRNRIGAYWDAGDLNLNLDGCDTGSPWSAVFISFVMDQAGAGPDFNYAISHREYIEAAFDGFGLYNTVRDADNTAARVGDLVCRGRSTTTGWQYSNFVNWNNSGGGFIPTHCDLVTAVSGSNVTIIGGNLGNTVRQEVKAVSSYALVLPLAPKCDGRFATIVGTPGAETINGTAGADVIHGLGGDDTINGLGGADRICGGFGDDTIRGGNGADRIFGDAGADRLYGQNGTDRIWGGTGPDSITGGNHNDVIRGGSGADSIFGGFGADTLYGQNHADILTGGNGNDTLIGGNGHDFANGQVGSDLCQAENERTCER